MGGSSRSQKMYDTIRREYYYPFMSGDISVDVKDGKSCSKTHPQDIDATEKQLRLFPPVALLAFVATDLLGALTYPKRGQKHDLFYHG